MTAMLLQNLSLESENVVIKKNIILSEDVKEQGLSDIVKDVENESENMFRNK